MKTMTMRYPGDPPLGVREMTRAEFLKVCPRTPIVITSTDRNGVETIESFPMEEDEVICDLCNADPGEVVYLLEMSRAYCVKCATESWLPYCK